MGNFLPQLYWTFSFFSPPSFACLLVLNKHRAWREGRSRGHPLLHVQGSNWSSGKWSGPLVSQIHFWRHVLVGGSLPRILGNYTEERRLFPGIWMSCGAQFSSLRWRPFKCQKQPREKPRKNFSLKDIAPPYLSDYASRILLGPRQTSPSFTKSPNRDEFHALIPNTLTPDIPQRKTNK